MQGKIVEYIKKNPGKSILILLVGCGVIGALFGNPNGESITDKNIAKIKAEQSANIEAKTVASSKTPETPKFDYEVMNKKTYDETSCSTDVFIKNFTDEDIKKINKQLWLDCMGSKTTDVIINYYDDYDLLMKLYHSDVSIAEFNKAQEEIRKHLKYEYTFERGGQSSLQKMVNEKLIEIGD